MLWVRLNFSKIKNNLAVKKMYSYGNRSEIANKQRNIYLGIYLKTQKKKMRIRTSRALPARPAGEWEAAWHVSLHWKESQMMIGSHDSRRANQKHSNILSLRDKFIKRNVYYSSFPGKL